MDVRRALSIRWIFVFLIALTLAGLYGPRLRRWLGVLRRGEVAVAPVEACSRDPERTSVLVIVLDTTRKDALSPYNHDPSAKSPRIQRLADGGVVFEACSSAAAFSGPSYASLLTGCYPPTHGVFDHPNVLADENQLLMEMAQASGLYTVFLTQHSYLRKRWNYEQGAQYYRYGPDDEYLTDELTHWIEKNEGVAFMGFIALTTPHWPYDVAVTKKGVRDRIPDEDWELHQSTSDYEKMFALTQSGFSDGYAKSQRELYQEEIKRTDRLVGEILDALERTGRREKTMVILTADHGEGFGEHGYYFAHDPEVYGAVSSVPLIVSLPGRLKPSRVEEPVSLIDIFPTIMEEIGVASGFQAEGRSLMPLLRGETDSDLEPRSVFCYSRPLMEDRQHFESLSRLYELPGFAGSSFLGSHGKWDLVVRPTTGGLDWELFDRKADPLHLVNVRSKVPREEVAILLEDIKRYRQRFLEKSIDQNVDNLSDEQREALIELGYLEDN